MPIIKGGFIMNKEQIREMVYDYRRDMLTRGIKAGKVEGVYFTESSRKFGFCQKTVNGGFQIWITDLAMHGDIKSTIVHELIHTVEGCYNHGQKFQSLANWLGRVYGIELGTRASKKEMALTEEYRIAKAKYIIRCKKCGQLILRERATRIVKLPMTYSCGCGGDLVRIK